MTTPDSMDEAHQARERSRMGLLAAVDLGTQARTATARLRAHHERNHWGEGLELAMQLRQNGAR